MDEQLYLAGLGLSLPEKVEKAIATFRHYESEALKYSPGGYYLCDSYGKDSCVILDLAKRSGVKFTANHNLTTLDPPELIYFGRKNHPETIVHRPKVAMLTRLANEKLVLPTRMMRWCCQEYKEDSAHNLVKVYGIRASESSSRKANWKIFTPRREQDGWALNPVLYWSDDNVWQYINQNKIKYCSLYDDGFTRLGCIGCPMSNKRRKEFDRWPRYERAWKMAITKFWERLHSAKRRDGKDYYWHKFESPADLWSWWMEEMPKEDKGDECQMGLF